MSCKTRRAQWNCLIKRLSSLPPSCTGLGSASIALLAESLKQNKTLVRLGLSCNTIAYSEPGGAAAGPEGAAALAGYLVTDGISLEDLSLADNDLTAEGGQEVRDRLTPEAVRNTLCGHSQAKRDTGAEEGTGGPRWEQDTSAARPGSQRELELM